MMNPVESYLSFVVTLQNTLLLYVMPCWRLFGSQEFEEAGVPFLIVEGPYSTVKHASSRAKFSHFEVWRRYDFEKFGSAESNGTSIWAMS